MTDMIETIGYASRDSLVRQNDNTSTSAATGTTEEQRARIIILGPARRHPTTPRYAVTYTQ